MMSYYMTSYFLTAIFHDVIFQDVIFHDITFHDFICHDVICLGRCMMHDVMIYHALIWPDIIAILLLEASVHRMFSSTLVDIICENSQHAKSQLPTLLRSGLKFFWTKRDETNEWTKRYIEVAFFLMDFIF